MTTASERIRAAREAREQQANATMNGKPFHSPTVEAERKNLASRLAYIFHGR